MDVILWLIHILLLAVIGVILAPKDPFLKTFMHDEKMMPMTALYLAFVPYFALGLVLVFEWEEDIGMGIMRILLISLNAIMCARWIHSRGYTILSLVSLVAIAALGASIVLWGGGWGFWLFVSGVIAHCGLCLALLSDVYRLSRSLIWDRTNVKRDYIGLTILTVLQILFLFPNWGCRDCEISSVALWALWALKWAELILCIVLWLLIFVDYVMEHRGDFCVRRQEGLLDSKPDYKELPEAKSNPPPPSAEVRLEEVGELEEKAGHKRPSSPERPPAEDEKSPSATPSESRGPPPSQGPMKQLLGKLTEEEKKEVKEELITPKVEPGAKPGERPTEATIRRLVGTNVGELLKKFAKKNAESGKAEWTNTHFILAFDCSGN